MNYAWYSSIEINYLYINYIEEVDVMAVRHRGMYADDWVTVLGIALIITFLIWLGLQIVP